MRRNSGSQHNTSNSSDDPLNIAHQILPYNLAGVGWALPTRRDIGCRARWAMRTLQTRRYRCCYVWQAREHFHPTLPQQHRHRD